MTIVVSKIDMIVPRTTTIARLHRPARAEPEAAGAALRGPDGVTEVTSLLDDGTEDEPRGPTRVRLMLEQCQAFILLK